MREMLKILTLLIMSSVATLTFSGQSIKNDERTHVVKESYQVAGDDYSFNFLAEDFNIPCDFEKSESCTLKLKNPIEINQTCDDNTSSINQIMGFNFDYTMQSGSWEIEPFFRNSINKNLCIFSLSDKLPMSEASNCKACKSSLLMDPTKYGHPELLSCKSHKIKKGDYFIHLAFTSYDGAPGIEHWSIVEFSKKCNFVNETIIDVSSWP
jgi:hypothetical protein